MKVVFPQASENQDTQSVLKSAVQMTCDALIGVYHIDGVKLTLLINILADSILENFKDGQRDASVLAHLATMQALKRLGHKLS